MDSIWIEYGLNMDSIWIQYGFNITATGARDQFLKLGKNPFSANALICKEINIKRKTKKNTYIAIYVYIYIFIHHTHNTYGFVPLKGG